ncbi:hypothetical protein IG631_08001 [Alternaria alternata]|nr:hypothetical protein IG631_08001 [Alternaria alternata]
MGRVAAPLRSDGWTRWSGKCPPSIPSTSDPSALKHDAYMRGKADLCSARCCVCAMCYTHGLGASATLNIASGPHPSPQTLKLVTAVLLSVRTTTLASHHYRHSQPKAPFFLCDNHA